VFQITLRKGYAIPDLKLDLGGLYMKAGVKNIGTVLLMTDAQVCSRFANALVPLCYLAFSFLFLSLNVLMPFPDVRVENKISSYPS
jgi:hypothetical protein